MTRSIRNQHRAFTLIEVLVVVAIIALLISILVPTLTKARDQARRAVCAAHLHQVMFSIFTYGNDHSGKGPYRGWFSYTVSESYHEALNQPRKGGLDLDADKTLVNMGLLYKKWIASQQDVLYCPSLYSTRRDDPDAGWPTLWKPVPPWTNGGYNYAAIVAARLDLPDKAPRSPVFRSTNAFPPDSWSTGFTDWTTNNSPDGWRALSKSPPGVAFKMPVNSCLASDFWIGGQPPPHVTGVNVAYTDGHVRYQFTNGLAVTSGSTERFIQWWRFTLKQ